MGQAELSEGFRSMSYAQIEAVRVLTQRVQDLEILVNELTILIHELQAAKLSIQQMKGH